MDLSIIISLYNERESLEELVKWIDSSLKKSSISNIEYEILSDNAANIYGRINLSKLVIALAKENCDVISSHEQDESLENYFINLVGGNHNG